MTNTYKLLVLPGDGIGPEVMNEALKISQCISCLLYTSDAADE